MKFTQKVSFLSALVVGAISLPAAAMADQFPVPCMVVPGYFLTNYGTGIDTGTFGVVGYAVSTNGQIVTTNIGPNYATQADADAALTNAKTAGICR